MQTLEQKPGRKAPYVSLVERVISTQIREGTLKPGDRIGPANELAKKLGVSCGSVRHSLEALAQKGLVVRRHRAGTFVNTDLISTETRPVAKANAIALLIPDIKVPEYACITRSIEDAAHTHKLDIIISSTDNERDRYDQLIKRRIESGVSGIVLVSPRYDRVSLETLRLLQQSKIPVVSMGNFLDAVEWPAVVTDVSHGTYLAVNHLCSLGRKKIAFISYESGTDKNSDYWYTLRTLGLYKALVENGVHCKPIELLVPGKFYSFECGWTNNPELTAFIGEWFDKNSDLDAIRCEHDHIAAAVLHALRGRKIRVPQDIAVVGNGCMSQFYGLAPGELTSTDTNIASAALKAIELIMSMIRGEQFEKGLKVLINPELKIGRSTQFEA